MLETLDLTHHLSKKEYLQRLPGLQLRLLELQQAFWREGVPSVLVVEGWDGAGKGKCVRKLTERLEPRGYRLCQLSPEPRTYEESLPWMWRFWLEIPNYGQMTIFHNSWHRKALLDRSNGRLDELQWHRVFRDILDFERTLGDDGYVFIKFFLHISEAERRRRYKTLEKDPLTRWKITRRDWKHHRRYPEFYPYVEWMLERTEAAWAPWHIIAATDLRWARISMFETVVQRLEQALISRGLTLPAAEVAEDASDDRGIAEDCDPDGGDDDGEES